MKRLLFSKDDSTTTELQGSENNSSTETCKPNSYKITALSNEGQIQSYIKESKLHISSSQLPDFQQIVEKQQPLSDELDIEQGSADIQQRGMQQAQKKESVVKVSFDNAMKKRWEELRHSSEHDNASLGPNRLKQLKFKLEKFIIDENLRHGQKELEIEQQKIYFPYQPYSVQLEYMNNVIKALNSKENALLESPTGTGKTLCLLASVLSWTEQFYLKTHNKTKIIYMSRTHSQLKQVHKELEKTCFRPNMAIFASREQLCIKEQLSQLKGREKIEACSRGVKLQRKIRKEEMNGNHKDIDPKVMQSACQFYKQREEVIGITKKRLANVLLDIPAMKKIGQQEQFCPYFYPHHVKNTATLFLMPYNYLLDAYLLSSYSELITDSIIIFDEAHNVPETACDGRSLTLQSSNLEGAIVELNGILSNYASQALMDIRAQYEKQIKFIIRNLEDFKENFQRFGQESLPMRNNLYGRQSWQKQEGDAKIFNLQRTDYTIFELFCGKVIKDERRRQFQSRHDYYRQQMKAHLLNPVKEIVQYGEIIIEALKETHDGFCNNFDRFFIFANKIHNLLLPLIYQPHKDQWLQTEINHFRLYLQRNPNNPNHFTFGLRCLVPWLTFESIMKCGPRSVILTSGTLRPLEMWQKQLQMKFRYQLTNKHVIKPEQINSKVLCCGPSQTSFTFTYDNMNRNKESIYRDLIETIIQISSSVPNGILLVFPSFRMQNEFRFEFNRSNKRQRLLEFKDMIFEERSSDTDLQSFKKKALSRRGAVLAMICRGKLSEGIDFPDGMCRAVIMIGIPYPNIKDPFIIEKKNHLDQIVCRSSNKNQAIRGEEWYFMGTIRSINQALGRVIRHASDYGMIFLVDKRYKEPKFSKELPGWITESLEAIENPTPALYTDINTFYQEMKGRFKPIHSDCEQPEQGSILGILHRQRKAENLKKQNKNGFNILMMNRRKFQRKRWSPENDFI